MAEVDHWQLIIGGRSWRWIVRGRSFSYERSGLDLPDPKYDSSPTSKLLKGPTFQALVSGGVHTWEEPALRGGETYP